MTVERANRKTLIGNVVKSGCMAKTVLVSINTLTKHPFYGKYIKSSVNYAVHDEKNESKTGDKVTIISTRPLSKTKRWRLKEILEKAK
ncbi:MAG: 30S ribosomal protein S17 [Deltaproteobacteria bacterium]|nr:30S ribosomal protein S17 [Deltaproteobacteria bacterium]